MSLICFVPVELTRNFHRNIFFALYQGGPQTFAWGVFIVSIRSVSQAASIAEMSSTLPIAGAQYHRYNGPTNSHAELPQQLCAGKVAHYVDDGCYVDHSRGY